MRHQQSFLRAELVYYSGHYQKLSSFLNTIRSTHYKFGHCGWNFQRPVDKCLGWYRRTGMVVHSFTKTIFYTLKKSQLNFTPMAQPCECWIFRVRFSNVSCAISSYSCQITKWKYSLWIAIEVNEREPVWLRGGMRVVTWAKLCWHTSVFEYCKDTALETWYLLAYSQPLVFTVANCYRSPKFLIFFYVFPSSGTDLCTSETSRYVLGTTPPCRCCPYPCYHVTLLLMLKLLSVCVHEQGTQSPSL